MEGNGIDRGRQERQRVLHFLARWRPAERDVMPERVRPVMYHQTDEAVPISLVAVGVVAERAEVEYLGKGDEAGVLVRASTVVRGAVEVDRQDCWGLETEWSAPFRRSGGRTYAGKLDDFPCCTSNGLDLDLLPQLLLKVPRCYHTS